MAVTLAVFHPDGTRCELHVYPQITRSTTVFQHGENPEERLEVRVDAAWPLLVDWLTEVHVWKYGP